MIIALNNVISNKLSHFKPYPVEKIVEKVVVKYIQAPAPAPVYPVQQPQVWNE